MLDFLIGFSYGLVLAFGAAVAAVACLAVYLWVTEPFRKRRVVRR